jgi:hypothetical protein
MEKRMLLVALGLTVVVLLGSAALAGAPLGPPKAFVGHGQWAVDVEYAHQEVDLKACGKVISSLGGGSCDGWKIEDMRSNLFFGSLAYGLCDNWDVFVRLGMADAKDEMKNACGYGDEYAFDGSYGFAWGAGTRATFCQNGPWTVGAVGQVTWLNPDDDEVSFTFPKEEPDDPNYANRGTVDFDDWRELQVGLGVTYQADSWFVYGGPCVLVVNGDLDFDYQEFADREPLATVNFNGDLREESEFGGWLGFGMELPAYAATCYAEAQIYGDGWTIGGGLSIPLP